MRSAVGNSGEGWTQGHGYENIHLRYREVPPHICEMHEGVKSYSGYVDISKHEHIFFWFFEARTADPSNAPLTAWISGGPGDSSMAELFTEHGPCRIDRDRKTIHYNPYSWNQHSNTLYIDQPVQVGFSYSKLVAAYYDEDEEEIVECDDEDDCPDDAVYGKFSRPDVSNTTNSTPAAAPNFWLTLQAFMTSFPQYSNNGFHFGSESYGGHYVPIFSKYILSQNERQIPGARHIDLRSVLIGNGWFSAQIQTESYYRFAFESGNTYDLKEPDPSVKKQVFEAWYGRGGALEQLKKCNAVGSNKQYRSATNFCGEKVQAPFIDATQRDDNDIRYLNPSPFPNYFYIDYLRRPEVRKAIGARQTFIQINPTVGAAFEETGDDSRDFRILEILKELAGKGIHVTLYAGDADYECNWLGVESVTKRIGIPGYNTAGYTDVITVDGVVHGQVKQSGPFSFVRVYEAGHAVGAYQPLVLQTLFERTISGTDLATGRFQMNARYQSQGSPKSTYRQGNATVQHRIWPENATYDFITNQPTLDNFQPDGKR